MKKFNQTVHIFRRDLRIHDNTALLKALKTSKELWCVFVFDPRQIERHEYRSIPGLQCMLESLQELYNEIYERGGRLCFFSGEVSEVLKKIIKNQSIDCVSWNKDYTPFSLKRDNQMREICKKSNVAVIEEDDALLQPPGKILTGSNQPYKVFTPFMRRARDFTVAKPVKNMYLNFASGQLKNDLGKKYLIKLLSQYGKQQYAVEGGREAGKKLLRKTKKLEEYKKKRDFPAYNYTSHLSAHNKFGTISIREVYYYICKHFGSGHALVSELYWRDFFTHIGYHFPHVFTGAFYQKYNKIKWSKSKKNFQSWCEGKTGYPIVDAGMRELNETGYMHNRVRMITASFLVKDLHINWKWGEKYFAQKLIDYDPAVNNGNWQWVASTGCDAQPYFRVFNPWRQAEKFDKDCVYVKKWLPDLKNMEAKDIFKLEKNEVPEGIDYPNKIVDHKDAAKKTKEIFGAV